MVQIVCAFSNFKGSAVAVLAVLLLSSLRSASSAGIFELQLLSYANPHGLDALGQCCSSLPVPLESPDSTNHELLNTDDSNTLDGLEIRSSTQRCSSHCSTFFRICLKQYQTEVDHNPPCTYGSFVSNELSTGSNSVDFSRIPELKQPLRFPFSFRWPGAFSLIVEVWHNASSKAENHGEIPTTTSKQLLLRVAEAKLLESGPAWTSERYIASVRSSGKNASALAIKYRVLCGEHFYGDGCARRCRPLDDVYGHYTCDKDGHQVCMDGWQGHNCQDPICKAGCMHGSCARPGECVCELGYIGESCDQCQRYPGCQHGDCDAPFTCKCHDGWGGLFCNQDLNYCTHHKPCKNGATCTNTGAGWYSCHCLPGYTGVNCETKIEDCSQNPCLNGAVCGETGSNYTCTCLEGFSGRHCQTSAQTCSETPCENAATCLDNGLSNGGGYTCVCPPGWEGKNCDIESDECEPNPCQNGGRCMDDFNGFQCVCPIGFTGDRCETNINDCSANACLNGGTCEDLVNSFRCNCVPGYTGMLCQHNFDDCIKRPCANGGTCIDQTNGYFCSCRPGYKGKDCSIDINECAERHPCRNGGSCIDGVDDYTCTCPPCFSGKNCDKQDPYCASHSTFAPIIIAAATTTPPAIRIAAPEFGSGHSGHHMGAYPVSDQGQPGLAGLPHQAVTDGGAHAPWQNTAFLITIITVAGSVIITLLLIAFLIWMLHQKGFTAILRTPKSGGEGGSPGRRYGTAFPFFPKSPRHFPDGLPNSRHIERAAKIGNNDLEAARQNEINAHRHTAGLKNNVNSLASGDKVASLATPFGKIDNLKMQQQNQARASSKAVEYEPNMKDAAGAAKSSCYVKPSCDKMNNDNMCGKDGKKSLAVQPCPTGANASTSKFPFTEHNIYTAEPRKVRQLQDEQLQQHVDKFVEQRKIVYTAKPYCHTPPSTPVNPNPPTKFMDQIAIPDKSRKTGNYEEISGASANCSSHHPKDYDRPSSTFADDCCASTSREPKSIAAIHACYMEQELPSGASTARSHAAPPSRSRRHSQHYHQHHHHRPVTGYVKPAPLHSCYTEHSAKSLESIASPAVYTEERSVVERAMFTNGKPRRSVALISPLSLSCDELSSPKVVFSSVATSQRSEQLGSCSNRNRNNNFATDMSNDCHFVNNAGSRINNAERKNNAKSTCFVYDTQLRDSVKASGRYRTGDS